MRRLGLDPIRGIDKRLMLVPITPEYAALFTRTEDLRADLLRQGLPDDIRIDAVHEDIPCALILLRVWSTAFAWVPEGETLPEWRPPRRDPPAEGEGPIDSQVYEQIRALAADQG